MTAVERPCGCDVRWPCQCSEDGITESGTFRRECRYCEVVWEGRRHNVINDWWAHIRSAEHDATYAARRDHVAVQDAERKRAITGQLW